VLESQALQLGQTLEVAIWEIAHLESSPWEVALGKYLSSSKNVSVTLG